MMSICMRESTHSYGRGFELTFLDILDSAGCKRYELVCLSGFAVFSETLKTPEGIRIPNQLLARMIFVFSDTKRFICGGFDAVKLYTKRREKNRERYVLGFF